jgi:hypothetical protein
MNVEIGADAALFPEKEYINGIAVAVYSASSAFFKIINSRLAESASRFSITNIFASSKLKSERLEM